MIYTVTDACVLLNIHNTTLWRWMKRAKIDAIKMDSDLRCRYLRMEDVQRLAREHGRVLIATDVEKLTKELAELKREVASIKKAGHP